MISKYFKLMISIHSVVLALTLRLFSNFSMIVITLITSVLYVLNSGEISCEVWTVSMTIETLSKVTRCFTFDSPLSKALCFCWYNDWLIHVIFGICFKIVYTCEVDKLFLYSCTRNLGGVSLFLCSFLTPSVLTFKWTDFLCEDDYRLVDVETFRSTCLRRCSISRHFYIIQFFLTKYFFMFDRK